MKIIKSLNEIMGESFVATIGNFDGVHLGHKDILRKIRITSEKEGGRFVVITFVPHPICILKPQDHFLLNSYKERRQMIKELGVDFLFEVDFTRDFSTQAPEDFLNNYLFTNDNLKKLFVGYDFAFGANKAGDFKFLEKYCLIKGIEVYHLNEFVHSDLKVSSSSIREQVKSGLMEEARDLLGRNFFLSGRVTKGEGRGRKLSYPTANLEYSNERLVPDSGVYITQVKLKSGVFNSVTNIGRNPTFNSDHLTRIETHIFDFNEDIYGEEIEIHFHKRLRLEKKFESVDQLIEQIGRDVASSKEYFKCLS